MILSAFPGATTAGANKVFVFDGKIRAVDATAKLITLNANKRSYVFAVTDRTKLTKNGSSCQFADLKVGFDAEVEMNIGPGGKGIASSVKLFWFSPSAPLSTDIVDSVTAGTAPNGALLSAQEVRSRVVSMTWPGSIRTLGMWSHKIGVFLLSVNADGTVSKVEILQSIGHGAMDAEAKKAFMKWRFRPNSVKEVRIPLNYTRAW